MTGSNGDAPGGREDQEWLVLTEGMSPYERFRYIARHILASAVDEAGRYATDDRIFDDPDGDPEAGKEHLERLDDALRDDGSLPPLERAFLCAAVRAAMEEREMEPRCLSELVGIFAEADGDGSRPEPR